jgi:hypothetical protein
MDTRKQNKRKRETTITTVRNLSLFNQADFNLNFIRKFGVLLQTSMKDKNFKSHLLPSLRTAYAKGIKDLEFLKETPALALPKDAKKDNVYEFYGFYVLVNTSLQGHPLFILGQDHSTILQWRDEKIIALRELDNGYQVLTDWDAEAHAFKTDTTFLTKRSKLCRTLAWSLENTIFTDRVIFSLQYKAKYEDYNPNKLTVYICEYATGHIKELILNSDSAANEKPYYTIHGRRNGDLYGYCGSLKQVIIWDGESGTIKEKHVIADEFMSVHENKQGELVVTDYYNDEKLLNDLIEKPKLR